MNDRVIAFPHMGNYDIPIKYLLKKMVKAEIMTSPPITTRTIKLGTKYSPEFICMPFKYTLGTLIESLEKGANILVQVGGGCRYGYYSELQEQILKDLGYDFIFINLVTNGKSDIKKIYHSIKQVEPKFNLFNIIKSLYYFFITAKMVKYMDLIDDYIRKNMGFEVEKNSFFNLKKQMLDDFSEGKNFIGLRICYQK